MYPLSRKLAGATAGMNVEARRRILLFLPGIELR
jgi:hypothetical protein